jgi:hypothetical protein
MKVKLRTIYASAKANHDIGEIAEFPDREALELIKGGYAMAINPRVERAVIAPCENASAEPVLKQKLITKKPVKKGKK